MVEGKLPADEQRLAAATKRAVQAAGGLKVCEDETKVSDSQISRCCSPNHRDSISVRDAVRIDAIGAGEAGHPHIINAMAGLLGGVFIMLPEPVTDDRCLQMSVIDLSCELGDVSRAISEALSGTSDAGTEVSPREAQAALDHLADLDRASAKLRHQLQRLADGKSD
ncbi:hypothetical protein GGQ80_002055 [Sphingomonas jinjuensis]|uniref:Uncharacterized protein n=1 Tax=Sphingomonas jinjuensis TaxID=535907 RepID=A0A840FLF4_9SPHN|nr:phage regulatory CII family protein [Sphingomonas jinjuensis]MBB4154145.1 hypothetical protein [Sphingomonas jinjuensis]